MTSVSLEPLASLTPDLSKASLVTADLWPLKLTRTVAILLSQRRMLPSSYPTAKKSGSALLCAIAVTGALHRSSFQRLRSSPFFISQQRTSSLAATTAWPALVPLRSLACQTMFDVAEATTPKDLACSYLLQCHACQP